jgi:hypothetical protein
MLARAMWDAGDRQGWADRQGLQDYYGARAIANAHYIGRVPEIASEVFFGCASPANVGRLDAVDVGELFDVRGRQVGKGFFPAPELPIKVTDKPHLPYMLAWVDMKQRYVEFAGWLLGAEAMHRIKLLGTACGARGFWFVPPPYHSVQSFKDWLWVGAPRHTWKPPA